jgi:RNA polymerase sigma factor (TIGR02999 family)
MPGEGHFTQLLKQAKSTDDAAALIPHIYTELRQIARRQMAAERANHTLQATALVHEAFVRLCGAQKLAFNDRAHFLAAAAHAMRNLLLEHARNRGRIKRGGKLRRVPLDVVDLAADTDVDEVHAIDDAMKKLEEQDARMAQIVRLRFFTGTSSEETARVLGISERTVRREWRLARAWLARELGVDDATDERTAGSEEST